MRRCVSAVVFAFLLFSKLEAQSGYSYQRTITIDHTKVPNTDQTNFPVLVSLTDSLLKSVANGGHVTSSNGYDLIFTSDVGCSVLLNYEVESWNATTGQLIAWVQVPALSHSTNTTISLCYGNASVTTDQSNHAAVWDTNYRGVWHLGNGSTLATSDSTSNANNGTNSSATAVSGVINGGASFNGSADISMGSATGFNIASTLTLSVWFQTSTSQGAYARLINKYQHPTSGYDLDLDGFEQQRLAV